MFQTIRGSVLATTTVLLYSLSYVLGAATLREMSPMLLIVLRFAMSAILLWSLALVFRLPVPRGRLLAWTILGGLLVQGVQFLGLYWGMAHGVSPAIASLVIALNPVLTALLGSIFSTRIRWAGWLSLACGLVGILIACAPRVIADPRTGPEMLTVLLALVGLACGSLLQGRYLTPVHPTVFTAIGVTASFPFALMLLPTETIRFERGAWPWFALTLLVLASAIGAMEYAALVRGFTAQSASMLFCVIPAVTAMLSAIILGEAIHLTTFVGLVFGATACALHGRSVRLSDTSPSSRSAKRKKQDH